MFCAILSIGAAQAQPHALRFDGSNDHVEVAEPVACIPGPDSFTIEFWARTSPDATAWNLPFEWRGGDRIYVGQNVGAGWNFVIASNGRRTDTHADAHIADIKGRWVFVQAVLDREANTQTLRVYDKQHDTWHEASVTPAPGETNPSGPLHISSHPDHFPFNGEIAEMRFWRAVRTQAEALEDMNKKLDGDTPGLAAYWDFDHADDTLVRDLASGRHDGVIAGAQWVPLSFLTDLTDIPAPKGRPVAVGPVELWNSERDLTYTWYLNGEEITGYSASTENVYTIPEVSEAHTGAYQVIATDNASGKTYMSSLASLYIAYEDWPMWQYDAARSGRTPVALPDTLGLAWVRRLPEPKRAWRHQWDHRGKLDFDVSYSPVVLGDQIYVPSNVTDSVTAYHTSDGRELWRFYTDGPVRLAPVAWEDKVFFVSDDGHLYCVDAASGSLHWKFRGGPSDHRLLGNERIISFWSARGGPVIKDGTIYFAAGIWPMHGVFIYALDAETGSVVWVNDTTSSAYVQLPHDGATGVGSIAPQGYIAASDEVLIVAGGRTPPATLDRHTGEVLEMSLRAKPQGGYAVNVDGIGRAENRMLTQHAEKLKHQIDGEVFEVLAAHDRLFITTTSGHLYCFAPDIDTPVRHDLVTTWLSPRTAQWAETAQRLVDELGEVEGYALMLGAGSGELLKELLLRSELHIVVVEPDTARVRALRDELADAGVYGWHAAVIEAEPATFKVQPYLFSMIVSEDLTAAGIHSEDAVLASILERLRPYGGIAYLGADEDKLTQLADAARAADVDQVHVALRHQHVFAHREGPLTGAGHWTHQYADASNTNFSPDNRTKTPLGILWFGGPCNNDILPRHGHGPIPQVITGKVILPGNDTVSARCVYTGRDIWQQSFPGLGHPFTDLELEARFEEGQEVFMHSADGIGANQLGSPFVSLPDGIYVRYMTRIYRLSPATGEVVSEFQLPVAPGSEGKPDWGHLSIQGDVIITTVEPQVFEGEGTYTTVFETMADIKGRGWEGTSSRCLVALDRHSGEVLWNREAQTGFRHNAIVSGGNRLYLIDRLSDSVLEHLQRRGEEPGNALLLSLDLRTGDTLWTNQTGVFGTWLGYSAEHDILIQGGRPGGLRMLQDEPGDRISAFQGNSGDLLWENLALTTYWGPLAIRKDEVYMAPAARSGAGYALNLLTGERKMRTQELTGESATWAYNRRYGCNSHNLSEHLITFRSGAAAYYDLEHDTGTGFFGGFRSGCTNNMVVADGVLNAPDYTRTCTCSYQHQTSLALIHMPDMPGIESWALYEGAMPDPLGYGINFGAPGRRIDHTSGRIWFDSPGNHRRHASAMLESKGSIDWVAASAIEITEVDQDSLTLYDLLNTNYTVRLHFAEHDTSITSGQRVFDIVINGEVVCQDFDIYAETGSALLPVIKEFYVDSGTTMSVALRKTASAERYPIISGIELIANCDDIAVAKNN